METLLRRFEGLRSYDASEFATITVTGTGFKHEDRANLRRLCTRVGINYSGDLQLGCSTHLVVNRWSPLMAPSEKMQRALEWAIPIVGLTWLLDSIREGAPRREADYLISSSTTVAHPANRPSLSSKQASNAWPTRRMTPVQDMTNFPNRSSRVVAAKAATAAVEGESPQSSEENEFGGQQAAVASSSPSVAKVLKRTVRKNRPLEQRERSGDGGGNPGEFLAAVASLNDGKGAGAVESAGDGNGSVERDAGELPATAAAAEPAAAFEASNEGPAAATPAACRRAMDDTPLGSENEELSSFSFGGFNVQAGSLPAVTSFEKEQPASVSLDVAVAKPGVLASALGELKQEEEEMLESGSGGGGEFIENEGCFPPPLPPRRGEGQQRQNKCPEDEYWQQSSPQWWGDDEDCWGPASQPRSAAAAPSPEPLPEPSQPRSDRVADGSPPAALQLRSAAAGTLRAAAAAAEGNEASPSSVPFSGGGILPAPAQEVEEEVVQVQQEQQQEQQLAIDAAVAVEKEAAAASPMSEGGDDDMHEPAEQGVDSLSLSWDATEQVQLADSSGEAAAVAVGGSASLACWGGGTAEEVECATPVAVPCCGGGGSEGESPTPSSLHCSNWVTRGVALLEETPEGAQPTPWMVLQGGAARQPSFSVEQSFARLKLAEEKEEGGEEEGEEPTPGSSRGSNSRLKAPEDAPMFSDDSPLAFPSFGGDEAAAAAGYPPTAAGAFFQAEIVEKRGAAPSADFPPSNSPITSCISYEPLSPQLTTTDASRHDDGIESEDDGPVVTARAPAPPLPPTPAHPGADDTVALKLLQRAPRGSSVKARYRLANTRCVRFAEEVHLRGLALTLNLKAAKQRAMVLAPGGGGDDAAGEEGPLLVEPLSFYRLLGEDWMLECRRFYTATQAKAAAEAAEGADPSSSSPSAFLLPRGFDPECELLRSTRREHMDMRRVAGTVAMRRAKDGMGALRMHSAARGRDWFWRREFDPETGSVVL